MTHESAIYEGVVQHRRTGPVEHVFRYRLFLMYLDLAELPELFSGHPAWSVGKHNIASFWRRDYFGPSDVPLDTAVRDGVEERTGFRPTGPIRMLTNLRYFGYCQNPVSFYYCFDPSGTRVEAILAEITNTPWGERHAYALAWTDAKERGRGHDLSFPKAFHVSPFIDMDVDYRWRFSDPAERLFVHMQDFQEGQCFFNATLSLKRREIRRTSLTGVLFRYPWMTARIGLGIYWQALRLRLKNCPVYSHPTLREESNAHASSHA